MGLNLEHWESPSESPHNMERIFYSVGLFYHTRIKEKIFFYPAVYFKFFDALIHLPVSIRYYLSQKFSINGDIYGNIHLLKDNDFEIGATIGLDLNIIPDSGILMGFRFNLPFNKYFNQYWKNRKAHSIGLTLSAYPKTNKLVRSAGIKETDKEISNRSFAFSIGSEL